MSKSLSQLNDLLAAYRLIFGSNDGQAVMDDLRARFHMSSPTFVAGDPHESAFLEGQRSVVLTIERMINPDRTTTEGEITDG